MPTSPAIRRISAAMLYPGTGLWEGLNLQEGRGTDLPFELFGAPWMDGQQWWNEEQLATYGVRAKPVSFTPHSGRYAGEYCHGLQLEIISESELRPVMAGTLLIAQLAATYGPQLTEATYPTLANPAGTRHLDLLLGIPHSFQHLVNNRPIPIDIVACWQQKMASFLLYQ